MHLNPVQYRVEFVMPRTSLQMHNEKEGTKVSALVRAATAQNGLDATLRIEYSSERPNAVQNALREAFAPLSRYMAAGEDSDQGITALTFVFPLSLLPWLQDEHTIKNFLYRNIEE